MIYLLIKLFNHNCVSKKKLSVKISFLNLQPQTWHSHCFHILMLITKAEIDLHYPKLMALLSSPIGYNNKLNTGKTLKVRLSSTIFLFLFNLIFCHYHFPVLLFKQLFEPYFHGNLSNNVHLLLHPSLNFSRPHSSTVQHRGEPSSPIFLFALKACLHSVHSPILPIAVPMKTD